MNIGKLRHRVKFQRQTEDKDKFGNVRQDWADHLTVWGNLRETVGKERIGSGAVENMRTATLRVRSSTAAREISEADRVIARGETWDIKGIANADDAGRVLDMLLQAGGTR